VDAQSQLGLWSALERQGKLAEAEEAVREAIALSPDLAEAHERLGQVLARQGRWREAEAAIREALRLDPGDARSRVALGAVLRRPRA
jgi:Flp pilus assembly protein TadD